MDCTLTSMTSIVYFLSQKKYKIEDIYNYTEKIAKKYLYVGTKGTPFVTIRKIFHKVLNKFGLPKAYVKYGKNFGYNFDSIVAEINKGNPLILTMNNDGRNYYENHSVTAVGYAVFRVGDYKIRLIKVYDNWRKIISYVDYEKMSTISTIHYSGLTFRQKHQMWKQLKNLK